jgi:medium-chain acyl-[acyl-carrier-protein] hydrolase
MNLPLPSSPSSARSWLVLPPHAPRGMRLYCFSYAGGNAAAYMPWQFALEPDIEVCAIQLPGRGARMAEAPITSLPALIASICAVLTEECRRDRRPFAFFGHSLGALLAFETARQCVVLGLPMPRRLIVSGCDAPQHRRPSKGLHRMPDDQLIAALARYNGSPAEVLAHRELMDLLLPCLRADFSLAENYTYLAAPPLPVPIAVLAGKRDPHVQPDRVGEWRVETTASCQVRWFEGDHFFIQPERDGVLEFLASELAQALAEESPRHANGLAHR